MASGFPCDTAVICRPGCRLVPQAIRVASVQFAELKAIAAVAHGWRCLFAGKNGAKCHPVDRLQRYDHIIWRHLPSSKSAVFGQNSLM
ncbi:MAG: arginase family protein [Geminicoccaceae bacterium]